VVIYFFVGKLVVIYFIHDNIFLKGWNRKVIIYSAPSILQTIEWKFYSVILKISKQWNGVSISFHSISLRSILFHSASFHYVPSIHNLDYMLNLMGWVRWASHILSRPFFLFLFFSLFLFIILFIYLFYFLEYYKLG
jgi:hypothetical protein